MPFLARHSISLTDLRGAGSVAPCRIMKALKMNLIALAAMAVSMTLQAAGETPPAENKVVIQPSEAAETVTPAMPEKMVCHKEKPTGSRVGAKKICKTATQWAAEKLESRQAVEHVQAGRYKSD